MPNIEEDEVTKQLLHMLDEIKEIRTHLQFVKKDILRVYDHTDSVAKSTRSTKKSILLYRHRQVNGYYGE